MAVCPVTELGFLRVAIQAYNATQTDARKALRSFAEHDRPAFVAADLSALEGKPFPSAKKSTDWYLADLAAHHGMKFATLDTGIEHPAVELIR